MQADGILDYDKVDDLLAIMSVPVVSMCVMNWVAARVREACETSQTQKVLVVLGPSVLQLLLVAIEKHALQRLDCFQILKVSARRVKLMHALVKDLHLFFFGTEYSGAIGCDCHG